MIGSIGGQEFLLILALGLLLFGPRKLPQIGRTLGRALAEFRGATQEFRSNLEREVEMENLRETRDSIQSAGQEIREAVNEATGIGVPPERSGSKPRDTVPGADCPEEASRSDPPDPPDPSRGSPPDGQGPTRS